MFRTFLSNRISILLPLVSLACSTSGTVHRDIAASQGESCARLFGEELSDSQAVLRDSALNELQPGDLIVLESEKNGGSIGAFDSLALEDGALRITMKTGKSFPIRLIKGRVKVIRPGGKVTVGIMNFPKTGPIYTVFRDGIFYSMSMDGKVAYFSFGQVEASAISEILSREEHE